jgi:hypothetical protein
MRFEGLKNVPVVSGPIKQREGKKLPYLSFSAQNQTKHMTQPVSFSNENDKFCLEKFIQETIKKISAFKTFGLRDFSLFR